MQQSPFHSYHVSHHASMIDYAGWELPILYRSIHEEHRQVRQVGGFFDVSHMGRLRLSGRHARRFLERMLTRRVGDMAENTCRYTLLCNEQGGVVDDAIVYRMADHWLLVVNAANRLKVMQHLQSRLGDLVAKVEDQTLATAMVAFQGPRVLEYIARVSREIPTLRRFGVAVKNYLIISLVVSRTGYTGEDGIEVILPATMASMALKMLVKDKGDANDPLAAVARPCGLGARDTLRMEAALPLYGHEMDESIDPLSAGLGFAVNLDKDQHENGEKFLGQDALQRLAAEGPPRHLIGLRLEGQRTARQGMAIMAQGRCVGQVTSGCISPTLGYPIAMALVESNSCDLGAETAVALGDKPVAAQVVPLPFYKRA